MLELQMLPVLELLVQMLHRSCLYSLPPRHLLLCAALLSALWLISQPLHLLTTTTPLAAGGRDSPVSLSICAVLAL